MNILLTGTRSFAGLTAARQFRKDGHTVFTADSIDFDYTGFSVAVKKRFEMPSVRFAEQKYVKKLIDIIVEYKIDRIVPLSEEIFYIARNAERIKKVNPKIIIEADGIEELDVLHNKDSFSRLAKSLNLRIPNTIMAPSLEDVIKYQKNIRSDIVLKPIYSRFADCFLHFENIKETKKYFSEHTFDSNYVLQDFIDGENISSFSLNEKAGTIVYRSDVRMNAPGAMGSVTKIETPAAIIDADMKLRKELGFKYQLGLDFILTPKNEYYLLEANPRATIGRLLQNKKHAQFRILAFHQLINGLIPKKSTFQFLKALFLYPDVVAEWNDPAPVIVSQIGCVGLASYLRFRKQHPGASFQAYSTYDMEYNGSPVDYGVEEANEKDNDVILSLIENLSTNQSFKIAQTRRPKPITSFLSDGNKVTVATVRTAKELAYLGVCAENDYFIAGKSKPVCYISAIRKNPEFMYQIDWRDLLFNYFKEKHKNVDTFLYAIMSDNTHAITSLTKPTQAISTTQLVCKYKTYIVNARKVKIKKLPQNLAFSRLTTDNIKEASLFLDKEGRKNDLFPKVTNLQKNFLNVTKDNSYILKRDNKIVGFAAVLDQTQKKQNFIKKYATWVRIFKKPFNVLAEPMKLIALPEEDVAINCPVVSLCLVKDNDFELYDYFVQSLSKEIRARSNIFTISMAATNPCVKVLDSRWNLSVEYNLYAFSFSKKKQNYKNIYIDGAIF